MRKVFKTFYRNLRDYGLAETLKKTSLFLVKIFYENKSYIIYRINTNKYKEDVDEYVGLTNELVGPHEKDLIAQIEDMSEWLSGRLENKLTNGCICLCALDRKKVVGFILVALEEFDIPLFNNMHVSKLGVAWVQQVMILPAYRKKGIGSHLYARLKVCLRERGINKIYGRALSSNAASLKTVRRVGGSFVREAIFIKKNSVGQWQCKKIKTDFL